MRKSSKVGMFLSCHLVGMRLSEASGWAHVGCAGGHEAKVQIAAQPDVAVQPLFPTPISFQD